MTAALLDLERDLFHRPAALTSSKLRSRVRATMETRGHKRVRWTVRERAEWHELVVVRGEAA